MDDTVAFIYLNIIKVNDVLLRANSKTARPIKLILF